jgi:regulator of nonsense transcripts 2
LLHQRYKDFAPTLLTGLQKMFFPGKGDEIESDRSSRAMRKRSTLRLLMELYFCGVFEEGNLFVNIVKDLTNTDHLRDRETTQTNLSLLVSFARQGRGLSYFCSLGLVHLASFLNSKVLLNCQR